ncbi:MAG: Dyp-type peroxidase [Rubrimonas sp.]|uniref:Dyp-type peroxidase n=1 Tax=Rubrimonas sp. TaxID=2036015 RepID=UPI002FDDC07A
MKRTLDLDDIQGNVVRAYGKFGYPKARYFFLNFTNAWVGRAFVREVLASGFVTTAQRWPKDATQYPRCTFNIGFTFIGLYMLELPVRTLQGFPDEFIDGMRKRSYVLGDQPATHLVDPTQPVLPSDPPPDWIARWDPIWRENRRYPGDPTDVHIWISMNARVEPFTENVVGGDRGPDILEERTQWLRDTCAAVTARYAAEHGDARGRIRILDGNGRDGGAEYQSGSALFDDFTHREHGTVRLPIPSEHFGFADGIGDPVFEGQYEPDVMRQKVIGRGKWMSPARGWEPLATGEFVLGYPDESQELPPAPRPDDFSRNGSFMAYRKLHQNVSTWRDFIREEGRRYARVVGLPEPQAEVALKSKMIGRWPDGVPLSKAPDFESWMAVRAQFRMTEDKTVENYAAHRDYLGKTHASDFKYGDDMQGAACPFGAHMRRVNTRDHLDPALARGTATVRDSVSSLNKRRRIMRRGLPYGDSTPGAGDDSTEQGVIMMVVCASLFRQYEFVQQQWIQYGLDFNAGNSTCPLVGNHDHYKRFVATGDPSKGQIPYIVDNLKTFVEPRGGEYFFIPSITALRMIARGTVDPT